MYDIIIIGAGAAGVSAAIYAQSRGKNLLVLEKKEVGGLIKTISTVTHYAGIIEGETGETFAKRLKEQAENSGVKFAYEEVVEVSLEGAEKEVRTEKNTYKARTVIIAGGTSPRSLGVKGEEELRGKGYAMNAAKDGENYRGKNVYVIGGADGAVKEAIFLAQYADTVTIVHHGEELACISEFKEKISKLPNIKVRVNSELDAVYGVERVESLELLDRNTGAIETIADPGCGIFVYIGSLPDTEIYTELELENGYIPVDENMETEIKGVYAIGDIRKKEIRQVSTAVADGTLAAIHASK